MEKVAILLRSLQLFAHNAHNLAKGQSFFADHEFLGQIYPQYEVAYDSVVERMLGLGMEAPLVEITIMAAEGASMMNIDTPFNDLLEGEQLLYLTVEELIKTPMTEGTRQLLGDICNESEIRQYKIKQRIK